MLKLYSPVLQVGEEGTVDHGHPLFCLLVDPNRVNSYLQLQQSIDLKRLRQMGSQELYLLPNDVIFSVGAARPLPVVQWCDGILDARSREPDDVVIAPPLSG